MQKRTNIYVSNIHWNSCQWTVTTAVSWGATPEYRACSEPLCVTRHESFSTRCLCSRPQWKATHPEVGKEEKKRWWKCYSRNEDEKGAGNYTSLPPGQSFPPLLLTPSCNITRSEGWKIKRWPDREKEVRGGGLCVVTGRTLETGCNKGALKSTPVPLRRERLENELSIPPWLQQLAVEDTGSGRGLKSLSPFYWPWVTQGREVMDRGEWLANVRL